jgi:hypothetical protein
MEWVCGGWITALAPATVLTEHSLSSFDCVTLEVSVFIVHFRDILCILEEYLTGGLN